MLQAHFSVMFPALPADSITGIARFSNAGGCMAVIHSSLLYVLNRFPSRKDAICRFFRENEEFQTICDDYRRCLEAIKRWDQSQLEEASARRREYVELLQELELEISRILNEAT